MSERHITMTRKQYDALKLMSRGYTYEEVAEAFGITDSAARNRITACRESFHCKTAYELFYRMGIAAGRNLPVRFIAEDQEPPCG